MVTDQDALVLAALRCEAQDVIDALQAAQERLLEEEPVDLSGIDARITQLCARAPDLPASLAHATLPDLTDLRGRVDTVIEALRRLARR